MELIIRHAEQNDYKEIHELNIKALGYDCPLDKTRERLGIVLAHASSKVLVAEQNSKVVGYINAADYECIHADSLKNVLSLAVDETVRGQGIGKKLLDSIEEWAKECKCAGVRLVSSFGRDGAHKFYLSCGYTDRKSQKNFIKFFKDTAR